MKEKKNKFISFLKENGLKPTMQRNLVVKQLLNGKNKHFTAEELYDEMKFKRFTWDGTFIGEYSSQGTGDGQLQNPSDIAIDPINRDVVIFDNEYGSNYISLINNNFNVRVSKLKENGEISFEDLKEKIDGYTALVAVCHIASQCGNILDIEKLGNFIKMNQLIYLKRRF